MLVFSGCLQILSNTIVSVLATYLCVCVHARDNFAGQVSSFHLSPFTLLVFAHTSRTSCFIIQPSPFTSCCSSLRGFVLWGLDFDSFPSLTLFCCRRRLWWRSEVWCVQVRRDLLSAGVYWRTLAWQTEQSGFQTRNLWCQWRLQG